MTGPDRVRRRVALALDLAIAFTGSVALALSIAGALAPRFDAAIPPAAMSPDGGHAFVVSPDFAPRWPYAVPSHPAFALAPGDVRLLEDGRPIGALDPAHADIRERGGGLHNMWEGALWFSPSDDSDPRTNGRDYRVIVKGCLALLPALALRWCVGLFAALATFRGVSLIASRRMPSLVRAIDLAIAPFRRAVGHVPLGFRGAYCFACGLLLGLFAWQALSRPMPINFEVDSFSFMQTGLLWDAGRDTAGSSTRDVGYPAITALALAMGSLDRLAPIQLSLVIAGLACILQVLYRAARLTIARLAGAPTRLPAGLTGFLACLAVLAYLALLFSHDLFVIDIYSAMGEAPHVLPTALALALFVGSYTARDANRRVTCAGMAAAAAYLSTMVKPHTAMVLALCVASFAIVALRHARSFRSPFVLAVCLAAAVVVGIVKRADAIVTPPYADFGPKTIMCNHLDVVAPVFDASTPGRARIAALMREVLQAPEKWTLLGLDGDLCVYNLDMTNAIKSVAQAEGLSTAAWQNREFLRAVAARPGAYAEDVWKQIAYYMRHPVVDTDHRNRSVMPDDVWSRLTPFRDRIGMSRDQFVRDVASWVPAAYPHASSIAKAVLDSVGATFAPFTLGATALAIVALLAARGRADLRLETVLVATAAFTTAFAMTTALAHSFDIARYLTDMLPFSLLWWVLSVTYLAYFLALCAALATRSTEAASARAASRPGFKDEARAG